MMSGKKLVSVGIPTYNRKEGLLRAINSVLLQDYENIEIVIGDNCSPEYNTEFVEKIKSIDPRIKYFRHKTNIGPVENFDFVRKASNGEYFLWLADDDWIDKNFISTCVEFLENKSEYILVNGSIKYYKDSTYFSVPPVRLEDDCPPKRVLNYYKTVADNGVYYGLMRKRDSDKVNLWNVMGSDWLFVANLAYIGKIGGIDNIYHHRTYTWNSDSIDRIVDQSGLTLFDRKYPYISIALHARSAVLNEPIYSGISNFHKQLLSWRIFLTVCKRRRIKVRDLIKALLCCVREWGK